MQVPGSRFLQGDFTTNETKAAMRKLLGGVPVAPKGGVKLVAPTRSLLAAQGCARFGQSLGIMPSPEHGTTSVTKR